MTSWSVFVGPAKTGKSKYVELYAVQAKCSVQVFDDLSSSSLAKLDPGGLVHYLEHNNFAQECIFVTRSPRVAQKVVSALLKVADTQPRVLVFALSQRLRFALGGLCGVTIDKVLVCANQERSQSMHEKQQDKQDKKKQQDKQDKKKQRCDFVWHEVGVDELASS
jgi:adenosyl cobinamide kinase/adenosyl cobinamide phosphate guanylyltransferase